MGERRQVTAGADRSAAGNIRKQAPVQELDELLDDDRPRAGVALGQRVCAQQERRADDLGRIRLADATGVTPEQSELQLFGELLRDRSGDETAEAGVYAVGVLLRAVDRLFDDRARCGHSLPGRVGDPNRRMIDGDGPDVREAEIFPGQGPALDHAPESIPAPAVDPRRPLVL